MDLTVTLNDGQTISLVLFGEEGTLFEISMGNRVANWWKESAMSMG